MIRQIIAVTGMGLRGIPQRAGAAFVIVIGIAVTVAVLVSVLAIASGFGAALKGSARPDRAIVIRAGSSAELSSAISRDDAAIIQAVPGVAQQDGKPVATADAVVVVVLPQKSNGSDANVTLRGSGPMARALRPEQRLVAGRWFRPGVHELVAGKAAAMQFAGLQVGSQVRVHDTVWTIVGEFESGGDSHESELIGDSETVLSAYRRNMFQSVTVKLPSAEAFDAFQSALANDPRLKVEARRETDYYAQQSARLTKLLHVLAYFVGGMMALGAIFGALNAMYASVAERTREIAVLRSIGFGVVPILASVMTEALVLSLAGGLAGAAAAIVLLDGNAANTLGATYTQVVFHLQVTPALVGAGMGIALSLGLLGGLFPSIRAARIPVAAALRQK